VILALSLLIQDAAALPDVVRSYYRLERDGRHAGYVSESYSPGKAWTRRVLDGDFVQNDRADLKGGTVQLSSSRAETGASLEWSPDWPIARMRSYELGTLDIRLKTPPLPPELTLFRLRADGALAAPGRITARMLDLEGELPALREVAMDVGPEIPVELSARSVRLTTIVFPEGCPGLNYATVRLDRYGRIVDGTRRDGSSLKLVGGEAEAVGPFLRGGWRTSCSKNPDGTWYCETLPR
jgi:hypothetical protein